MTPPPIPLAVPRSRILLCADDPAVASLAARMFDAGGFEVETVSAPDQALDHLTIQSYAAIAVNLKQLGAPAAGLVRELRARQYTRQLPVVLMSASADGDTLRFGDHPLLVSGWLQPPLEENRLVVGLRRAVASGDGVAPRILHLESDEDLLRLTSLAGEPNADSPGSIAAFAANDLSADGGERSTTVVLRNRKPETFDA